MTTLQKRSTCGMAKISAVAHLRSTKLAPWNLAAISAEAVEVEAAAVATVAAEEVEEADVGNSNYR